MKTEKKEDKKESLVAKKFLDTTKFASKPNNDDMYSEGLSYEDAKKKHGKGQSNNVYFMSKDQYEKGLKDYNDKKAQEVKQPEVKQSEAKTEKTWKDRVKDGTATDEDMKLAYDASKSGSYRPGPKTQEYFDKNFENKEVKEEAKTEPTIDNALDEIDNISASDKKVENAVQSFTNPETGDVDEDKANNAINEYEQKLVELGAATYDKDGNFVLKPTSNKKGWETWATLLSVGLSVIGIAMGVPILPINFKAVTGKDARDAQIQVLQQQYMDIKSDSAKTIDQMKADVGAGQIAQNNQDALAAQEKHAQATAATKDVIGAQTDASKQLIDKQTEADMKKAQQQLQSSEKIARLEMQHAKEMTMLSDKLSTASAKEVTSYSKTGWLVDYIKAAKAEGLSNKEIALAMAGLNGVTPTQMGLKNAESIVGMVTGAADSVSNFVPGKKNKKE